MPTLTWSGKDKIVNYADTVPVHVLNKKYNFGGETENKIIHGDNLLALKSLLPLYESKIKCIYIDPPYNTGNEGWIYNDNVNSPQIQKWLGQVVGREGEDFSRHDKWLCMMYPRLKLLKQLLSDDGAIFISIDDNEQNYLRCICDEIFGRQNFLAQVVWERAYAPVNLKKHFSNSHDYLICYAKNISQLVCHGLPRSNEADKRYKNPDNDSRGLWKSSDLSVGPVVESKVYEITTPSGRKIFPPKGYCWRLDKETFQKYVNENRIWFGEDGNIVPRIKRFLSEVKQSITPMSIWKYEDVGHTDESKKEIKALELKEIFTTPKPERLIERILTLATNEGDIVLDNFMGSGTTAAVAHKMKRRYIGVEQMEYIETVTVERLRKVIAGEQGGISKKKKWEGGGEFIYCELAKLNQEYVEEIMLAENFADIIGLYNRIVATGYISYKLDTAEFDKNIMEFQALRLEDQKRFLLEILDKNMLYVNYCDIDDEEFQISESDKNFTRSFYEMR